MSDISREFFLYKYYYYVYDKTKFLQFKRLVRGYTKRFQEDKIGVRVGSGQ